MRRYPVAGPSITDIEIALVNEAVRSAWYDDAGKYQKLFEEEFSQYLGVEYAIALPSCTSAIHLALLSLGVGEGDEVIVPDMTWIASSAPISYVGATPVFADIDRQSLCVSIESIKNRISEKTKAVVAVDLYGNMPNYTELSFLCDEHGLYLIEDAAEAIGSEFNSKLAGSFGDAAVFSFHGSKTLTSSEGGMLVTQNAEIASRVRFLCDHGREVGDTSFQNTEVAYKYKMSSLQAALGLGQLRRIDELVSMKREIFAQYKKHFANHGVTRLLDSPSNCASSYWMSTMLWSGQPQRDKHQLIKELSTKGIDSRPIFSPLSSLAAYKALPKYDNPNSYSIAPYGINLPSALCLKEADIEHISHEVIALMALR